MKTSRTCAPRPLGRNEARGAGRNKACGANYVRRYERRGPTTVRARREVGARIPSDWSAVMVSGKLGPLLVKAVPADVLYSPRQPVRAQAQLVGRPRSPAAQTGPTAHPGARALLNAFIAGGPTSRTARVPLDYPLLSHGGS